MATWGEIKKLIALGEMLDKQPIPEEDRIMWDPVTELFYYSDGRVKSCKQMMEEDD